MKMLVATVLISLIGFAGQAQTKVIKFDELSALINRKSDKIQVINFWATWCAPCVKELPLFQQLEDRKDPEVEITLINLDYSDKVKKVNSFVAKKNITSSVLLLDEVDYNAWIDRVDSSWGGGIPATLFINPKTGQRKFVENELKDGDLEKYIESLKANN
jgi:thiol-disulfide isomerase/thioredoxin